MPKLGTDIAEHDLDQLTSLFRLLSDRTRLTILIMLADGERNVTSLCRDLRLPQPTVSHHLGLLRVNNLVGSRRQGKQVFYALHLPVRPMVESALELSVEKFEVRIMPRAIEAMRMGSELVAEKA